EYEWEHWQKYGFVIIKKAITQEHANNIMDMVWNFQNLDKDDPTTWYPTREYRSDLDRDLYVYGFAEVYHHQLLWDSRQSKKVYEAFVDIWDCEELWTTLDRVNLNPPNKFNRSRNLIKPTDEGFDITLHWDIDTSLENMPQRVQGIIALNDSDETMGGFQCCPSLFSGFDEWKKTQPKDRDPIRPKVNKEDYPIIIPKLEAGDMLIFNGLLAHGVKENLSDSGVRAVQYLSMSPALEENYELRKSRVHSWETLSTPDWNPTLLGDAVKHESERYGKANLNQLGEKLLGLKSWRKDK
ncbi:phytanoyl-CoA dioxygenase, partial [Vibrio agarivorans]